MTKPIQLDLRKLRKIQNVLDTQTVEQQIALSSISLGTSLLRLCCPTHMLEALEDSVNSKLASIDMVNYERHRQGKPACSCGRPKLEPISAAEFRELLGPEEESRAFMEAWAETDVLPRPKLN